LIFLNLVLSCIKTIFLNYCIFKNILNFNNFKIYTTFNCAGKVCFSKEKIIVNESYENSIYYIFNELDLINYDEGANASKNTHQVKDIKREIPTNIISLDDHFLYIDRYNDSEIKKNNYFLKSLNLLSENSNNEEYDQTINWKFDKRARVERCSFGYNDYVSFNRELRVLMHCAYREANKSIMLFLGKCLFC
jgi:hypothetical protein